jgi:predicted RND superfamily exporter protein
MTPGAAGGLSARFSRALLAHRASGLAAVLALTALLGAGAARVRPDFSLEQLFPVGDADRAAYDRFRGAFPGEDARVVVLVTADDVLAPAGLARVAALEEGLRALPGVERVLGPASLDHVAPGPFGPARERLLAPGLDPAELARRAAAATTDPLLGWNLFTPGGRTVSVLADLDPSTAGSDRGRARFTAGAEALLARHAHPGQALLLSGLPPLRARIAALVAGDVGRLVPLAVLLVIVLLALAFRSAAAAAAGLVTVLAALVWSYGVLGLLGWPLGMLLSVLPIIVVIVSVSDTVHVLGETFAALESGAPPRHAITSALSATLGPCLVTEVVLAAGFLTLCAIRIQAAIQLGVVTAAAMLTTWLANALVLPLALSVLLRRPGARRPAAAVLRRVVAWSGRVAEERPGRVLAAAGLVLALAAAAATRVEVRYKVFDDLRPGSALAREIAFAEEAHGGLVPVAVHLLASGGGEDPALDPEALRAAERAAAFLRGFPEIRQANSLADLVRPLHRALAGEDPDGGGLPEDRQGVAQLLATLGDPRLAADLLSPDRTSLAAVGRAVDAGSARVEALFEEVDRWVAAEQARLDARAAGPRLRLEVTGQLRLFRDVNAMLLGGLALSFGAALVVSLVALSLALRSLRLGAVALVPNAAPVLLVLAFMGLAGIPLTPVTVLAFSMTLVIADDDTIQLLTRFRRRFEALPADLPQDERHLRAMRAAHAEAGVPMLTSGLAVSVGFALLLLSAFLGPARLGALIAVTLLGAAAADLLVTPVLVNGLLPLRPRRARSDAPSPGPGSPPHG